MQYSYGMTFILLLTFLTNKFIPLKLSSTRNNFAWVNQKLKWIAKQRDRVFRNIKNQVNLLIEKGFLTSSTYSEIPSNFLTNPTLRIFLMWPQMILPPNQKQKNSLHFSNIPNKSLPLLHLYTNTILSIRTTPRKPLFLMNSSSLFLVGSLLTASAPFTI